MLNVFAILITWPKQRTLIRYHGSIKLLEQSGQANYEKRASPGIDEENRNLAISHFGQAVQYKKCALR